tara:strand:- start:6621 stop:7151 length:531 start_codon:yes stop_codon:yes gene_type:complete
MKKILLILFVFISTHAFSQFGVKGGISYFGTTNSLATPDFSVGLSGGIFVKMGAFKPELNYFQHTLKTGEVTFTDNYLNISGNFDFDLGSIGMLAGVGWDYWLSSSVRGGGVNITADSGSSDLLMNLNVGVYYPVSDALIIDVRFQKPIGINVFEDVRFDYGIYTTMLTVGYMFGY